MDWITRPARPDDATALAVLKLATFRETFLGGGFAIPYPPADLARFEAASYAPDVVARELADAHEATWVAEQDGTMLGYARVGPCKLPHADVAPGAGELYQLYVSRAVQGRGIGAALLDVAVHHLRAHRPGAIWLGVWSGNQRAQDLYGRYGFTRVGNYLFPVGDWKDREFILRLD